MSHSIPQSDLNELMDSLNPIVAGPIGPINNDHVVELSDQLREDKEIEDIRSRIKNGRYGKRSRRSAQKD